MYLSSISEILNQFVKGDKRFGLLYHVTGQLNIPTISQFGLLPISEVRATIGFVRYSIGMTSFWDIFKSGDSIYFFTTPAILVAYIGLVDLITFGWKRSLLPYVVTAILPLDSVVETAPENGYSEGYPNALTYKGNIAKVNIYNIQSLDNFVNRFYGGTLYGS